MRHNFWNLAATLKPPGKMMHEGSHKKNTSSILEDSFPLQTVEGTPTPNDGKSQLNVVLLAGVGTLGFILVIAVVLLVVFLRRRRPVNEYIDVQSRSRILNSTTTQEFLGDGFYDGYNGNIK